MQRAHVSLVDDIDGTQAHETVYFNLDGVVYEIDLSSDHAAELRDILRNYIAHGRRTGGRTIARRTVGSGPRVTAAALACTAKTETTAIREWAASQGIPVKPQGRLAQDVIDSYHSRGAVATQATRAPRTRRATSGR